MERLVTGLNSNKIVMPTNVSFEDRNRVRQVVYYGRVSSEHEAQLSALANQMQWYDDQTTYHPNWNVINKYIDEGITGTQAKKRPAFMRMLADAHEHKFDLIVTREVCRFARNTVDTLVVTRELKNIGVEVYFVNDNIWTMDGDGELRLSLMATLAQEESRKTSERVRAGQKISRDKGVLYGNGNILGYDRVGSTYVINPEQAETVRMIYDFYLKGYGFTKIAHELIKLHRRDASGFVKWDCTKVSRVLHNATYMGYKCYLKSFRNNYLDQKSIINRDESTHMYVKGDFEPIIDEDVWYLCKEMREKKCKERGVKNGKVIKNGNRNSTDIWVKKAVCKCGCHFRKDKWHRNKSGLTYGYICYNVANNGSKSSYLKAGIQDTEGHCDIGVIADWKFNMMAYYIFQQFSLNTEEIKREMYSFYEQHDITAPVNEETIIRNLNHTIQKEKNKIENLTDMRVGGELSKEEYLARKEKISVNITKLEKEIDEIRRRGLTKKIVTDKKLTSQELFELLEAELDFTQPKIKEGLIDAFVNRVTPRTSLEFDWYLNLFPHSDSNEEYKEIMSFKIEYNDAHSYREKCGAILRKNQFRDLIVHVYA